MTRRRPYQPLPAEFASRLSVMRQAGDVLLDDVLAQAYEAGWSLRALGEAIGVTKQAVLSRVRRDCGLAIAVDIPDPGWPVERRRQSVVLDPDTVARLRRMRQVAATVNGHTPADAPARRVSREFSALLAGELDRGVSPTRLAEAVGMTVSGVMFRLGRHALRPLPPSPKESKSTNEESCDV